MALFSGENTHCRVILCLIHRSVLWLDVMKVLRVRIFVRCVASGSGFSRLCGVWVLGLGLVEKFSVYVYPVYVLA